jgi:dolichol-phosphate mannosyltransferase
LKYAWGRFLRGFLDLLTVLFLTRYQQRPLHLIGTIGLLMGFAGFGVLLYLTALWFGGAPIGNRPLLQLGVLLMVVAGQLFSFGLLAEMMTYIRHREQHDYPIRAIHGAPCDPDAENR